MRIPATLLLLCLPLAAQAPFGPAEARHLLSRAGFGGTPAEVDALVRLGRDAAADRLVDAALAADEPPFDATFDGWPTNAELARLAAAARLARRQALGRANNGQLAAARAWWLERMVLTKAPLREKMTLFWHGHFTSAFRTVRDSWLMVIQNRLLRRHALGEFGALLHAVARDPAMLKYLDNESNRKGHPNENFAREVMELFTLGTGAYSEDDIREAARAFTGWTRKKDRFVVVPGRHDDGVKTVLGVTGELDGGRVLDVLLAQERCPQHVAERLLAFFVGPSAPKGMAQRYAALLRSSDLELAPVLRALFKDTDFYRREVMGSRILGPVEYVVGVCRRLESCPPGSLLSFATTRLGQTLLDPPDVKGWEGDDAWITTASFLARGNVAGYLVEGTSPGKLRRDLGGDAELKRRLRREVGLRGLRWSPRTRLALLPEVLRAKSVEDLVDGLCARFLTVTVTAEARSSLCLLLDAACTSPVGGFRRPDAALLRKAVHMILSLPEAQLG